MPIAAEPFVKISEAFTYQFEDIQWPTKLGVGALISLVPILNFAAVGYEVAIVRNVAAGLHEPLPQWDDLGKKWQDGLILTLAGLVYAIPVFVALALVLAWMAATGALSKNASGRPVGAPNVVALACFMMFLLLYSLALSLIRPIILVLFSREATFAACFRLLEVVRVLNRQRGPFLTTWVVIILAGFAIGLIVGFINVVIGWIPCIGWMLGVLLAMGTAIYLLTVDGYLYGQFQLAAFGPENAKKSLLLA